ncbi:MAG: hypothetical protein K940chlam3_00278 [Chlamydiae bacterium]|nr:hypothetical protein [Chlamydiota bacterium]
MPETLISDILKEKLQCSQVRLRRSGTSALNQFQVYDTDRGDFFVKISASRDFSMLEAEGKGLELMEKTQTVRVPHSYLSGIKDSTAFLIIEFLDLRSHTSQSHEDLGRGLAQMHLHPGPEDYGLDHDNTIGLTPQVNTWTSSWIEFYRTYRLEFQLRMIEEKYSDTDLLEMAEPLLNRFPDLFAGLEVKPSLLHGDLWGGNTAALADGTPVVYDPACYYGHHEADLSMTGMFGGFSSYFFSAYHELIPESPGSAERIKVYQLYHYLNHYLLFGSSYRSACVDIMRRF